MTPRPTIPPEVAKQTLDTLLYMSELREGTSAEWDYYRAYVTLKKDLDQGLTGGI